MKNGHWGNIHLADSLSKSSAHLLTSPWRAAGLSLRLWRRGGRGHPEAEAATHSPNPRAGRKVLERVFFSPEICMFDHKGKRIVLEQLVGRCRVCAELLKQQNQHL